MLYFTQIQENEKNNTDISRRANILLFQDLSKFMKFNFEICRSEDSEFGYIDSNETYTDWDRSAENLAFALLIINEDRYIVF